MNDKKKRYKVSCILYTITSVLFALSGIIAIVSEKTVNWMSISNIALGITFASIAYLEYKKFKKEN